MKERPARVLDFDFDRPKTGPCTSLVCRATGERFIVADLTMLAHHASVRSERAKAEKAARK